MLLFISLIIVQTKQIYLGIQNKNDIHKAFKIFFN